MDKNSKKKDFKGEKYDHKETKRKYGKSTRKDPQEGIGSAEKNGKYSESANRIATKGGNDPEFYYVNERIGAAVANLPYNVLTGQQFKLFERGSGGLQPSWRSVPDNSLGTTPAVLALNYVNSIGDSYQGTSAVNIAAKAMYTWVRHQNSGHSNYESSDLMMYVLALAEIYTAYFEAKRIYATAMTYDYVNRYIPDMLLRAMRADPDNIRANLAQFRAQLNLLAAKISSLAVPNKYNLFKRKAAIASTVLMDSDSMRGQYYVWTRTLGFNYDPTGATGGFLKQHDIATNRTYTQIINELEAMVNVVLSDEDMNIMSGDILKAYGRENLYVLKDVDESETALFVFDENMLQQVENSLAFGITWDDTHKNMCNITQNNNVIKTQIVDSTNVKWYAWTRFIMNSHKKDPTWKDNLEFTRGMGFGSEYISAYTFWSYKYTSQGGVSVWSKDLTSNYVPQSSDDWLVISCISQFDWHPFLYITAHQLTEENLDLESDTDITYYGFVGDVKQFAILDWGTIEKLNESALMGLFNTLLLEQNTTY